MRPKDADVMANSLDHNQTASVKLHLTSLTVL